MTPLLSVTQIVQMTGRSRRTILRWFENEAGVIELSDRPETLHKRRYRTFRIPRHVYERVIERRAAKGTRG